MILSFQISICIQIHDKNHYGKFGQFWTALRSKLDVYKKRFLDMEKNRHGFINGNAYTANVVYQSVILDEIEKFKKSDQYKDPDEFDDSIKFFILLFSIFYV